MSQLTEEELVQYLYNETSESKTAAIKAALQSDWYVRELYEKLLAAHKDLDKVSYSPRPETIKNILEYAAKKQEKVHSR